MGGLVLVLFPIVWAIIATAIALLLYKTSKALYESRGGDKLRQRRIRLTGSVTIAAVAFCGMWYATDRLLDRQQDEVLTRVTEIDQLAFKVRGCIAVDQQRCVDQAQQLALKTSELRQILNRR